MKSFKYQFLIAITGMTTQCSFGMFVDNRFREAAKSLAVQTVENFIEQGANPNTQDHKGFSILDEVATAIITSSNSHRQLEIVKLLLNAGANPNHRDLYNNTPLFRFALHGRLEAVMLLLAAGANPDLENNGGQTVIARTLHSASVAPAVYKPIVEVLIAASRARRGI